MADTDSGQFMSSGIPSDFKPRGLEGQRVPDKKPNPAWEVVTMGDGEQSLAPVTEPEQAPYSVSENVKPEQTPTPERPDCPHGVAWMGDCHDCNLEAHGVSDQTTNITVLTPEQRDELCYQNGRDAERARIDREAEEYIALLHANGALAEAMGAEDVLAIVRGTFTGGQD